MKVTPSKKKEYRFLTDTHSRWAVVNHTSSLLIVLCSKKEYAELFLREYENEHGSTPWTIVEVNVE